MSNKKRTTPARNKKLIAKGLVVVPVPRPVAHPLCAALPVEVYGREILAYLESAHAFRITTPMQREALIRLAALPFECETVTAMCKHIASILALLEMDEDDVAANLFGSHLAETEKREAERTARATAQA